MLLSALGSRLLFAYYSLLMLGENGHKQPFYFGYAFCFFSLLRIGVVQSSNPKRGPFCYFC